MKKILLTGLTVIGLQLFILPKTYADTAYIVPPTFRVYTTDTSCQGISNLLNTMRTCPSEQSHDCVSVATKIHYENVMVKDSLGHWGEKPRCELNATLFDTLDGMVADGLSVGGFIGVRNDNEEVSLGSVLQNSAGAVFITAFLPPSDSNYDHFKIQYSNEPKDITPETKTVYFSGLELNGQTVDAPSSDSDGGDISGSDSGTIDVGASDPSGSGDASGGSIDINQEGPTGNDGGSDFGPSPPGLDQTGGGSFSGNNTSNVGGGACSLNTKTKNFGRGLGFGSFVLAFLFILLLRGVHSNTRRPRAKVRTKRCS